MAQSIRHEKYRHRIWEQVQGYLLDNPCIDCGEPDIAVLEFDHVRGEKRANISTMVQNIVRWDTIRSEIEKCDVRCANCHRRRTRRSLKWRTFTAPVVQQVDTQPSKC
jgi:hypothetical protein